MGEIKKVAVLINGGDTPGLNAIIRTIAKTAASHRNRGVWLYRGI